MSSRSTYRSRKSLALLALCVATSAAILGGCGGGSGGATTSAGRTATAVASQSGTSRGGPVEERLTSLERHSAHDRRTAYLERVRDAVVHGAAADFAIGTGIGGASFEACVTGLLREALDGPTIANLAAGYRRPGGVAYAAQALNLLTAPLADRCGHRSWVPELIEAARGLRSAGPIGAATRELGVTYGPFLGRRCRQVHRGCDLVGVDVVLGHAATRVEAVAGSQTIRLHTPGRHNGVPYRDWVGTFVHADFPARGPHWREHLPYVGVELRVHFADGRRASAFFPHVLLSSGWG